MAEKDTKAAASTTSTDGTITREAGDLGVPMLPGKPDEPQGPEDALGEGPKRGDYSGRIGPENYQPHEVRKIDGKLTAVAQRPRVEDVADAPGKGGVTTAEAK